MLYQYWRYVLSTCRNDQLFDSASNRQYSIFVDPSHIARVEESVEIYDFIGLLSMLEVAHEQVPSSVANLAVFLSWSQSDYLLFSAGKLLADFLKRSKVLIVEGVDVGEVLWTCRLTHTVTVYQENVQRQEITTDFRVHRSSAIKEVLTLV